MKFIVYTLIGLCVSASCADPATLELWLSTSGSLTPPAPGNAVLPVGHSGKVFLWARTPGVWITQPTIWTDLNGVQWPWTYTAWVGDVWHGISLDANTTIGFDSAVAGSGMSNPAIGTSRRWLTESDFSWANGDQFNVATLQDRGCGGMLDPVHGEMGHSSWDSMQAVPGDGYLYTRLGYIRITSAPAGATFFLTVGTGTIARRNGDPYDLVQFGVGDVPVLARQVGATSALADLTVIPEPGGLLMLAVAALTMRRQHARGWL